MIGDCDLQGIQYPHTAFDRAFEILPDAELEQVQLHQVVLFGYANSAAEFPDGTWRDSTAA